MTEADTKQLAAELCRRWKGKLNRDDLAYWARELDGYAIGEITEALTKFRNTSRFVPKPAEILKLLPRRTDNANAGPKEEGSFADVLRRQNRQYQGRCDIEVYLRYHRALWITYGRGNRNLDSMRRQLTGGCITNLMTAGMDAKQAERYAACIFDEPGMFKLVLEELRGIGVMTPEQEEQLAHVFD